MAPKKNLLLFFITLVLIISPCYTSNIHRDTVVCDYVASCFAYCEVYVDGTAKNPTRECCYMLNALNREIKHVGDGARRFCYCIEEFSNSHHHQPYLQYRIVNMTRICGVRLSFPISERMDCSKYVLISLNYSFSPFIVGFRYYSLWSFLYIKKEL